MCEKLVSMVLWQKGTTKGHRVKNEENLLTNVEKLALIGLAQKVKGDDLTVRVNYFELCSELGLGYNTLVGCIRKAMRKGFLVEIGKKRYQFNLSRFKRKVKVDSKVQSNPDFLQIKSENDLLKDRLERLENLIRGRENTNRIVGMGGIL